MERDWNEMKVGDNLNEMKVGDNWDEMIVTDEERELLEKVRQHREQLAESCRAYKDLMESLTRSVKSCLALAQKAEAVRKASEDHWDDSTERKIAYRLCHRDGLVWQGRVGPSNVIRHLEEFLNYCPDEPSDKSTES